MIFRSKHTRVVLSMDFYEWTCNSELELRRLNASF